MWPVIAAAAAAAVIPMLLPKPDQPSVGMPANVGAAVLRGQQMGGGGEATPGMGAIFGGNNDAAKQMTALSKFNNPAPPNAALQHALRSPVRNYGGSG